LVIERNDSGGNDFCNGQDLRYDSHPLGMLALMRQIEMKYRQKMTNGRNH